MRTAAFAGCLALLAACTPAPEQQAEAPPAPPAAAPATMADFAGTWNTVATLPGAAPVESKLVGSPDGSTWKMVLAGRDSIPLQASIVGDSLVTVSAEYESVIRAGVMVTVRTAAVRSGEELVGNLTATYKSATGEEVVNGTIRSTRAPM
jgi:hypothetical protein